MFTAEYEGINSFLIGASNLLLENGVRRITRGHICWELPAPFIFKITNPTARYITIPERKWNIVLPYAESLWLASGRNDLTLIGHYLKNMQNFSDDGFYLRGAYGPRLRKFNGSVKDYESDKILNSNFNNIGSIEIDQFDFIEKCFQRDKNTRQAIINIGDTLKDTLDSNLNIKETKDCPCTRILHFMKHPSENKLNLTVYMRSNDILWGASAVNIFNFTMIQEYFAKILNLEIGTYYHIVDNFHYYENCKTKIKSIAKSNHYEDIGFIYKKSFNSLKEFDLLIQRLSQSEEQLRFGDFNVSANLEDDFFNDWFKVLYTHNTKNKMEFVNPILNDIFEK
jgi:thymidylate synthase